MINSNWDRSEGIIPNLCEKKISYFIQRQPKKNQPKQTFGVYFPFFADLKTWLLKQRQKNQTQDLSLFYSIILQNQNFLSRLNFINSYWSRV